MTPRRKMIQGRTRLALPNLRGAMVGVAKRTTWPRTLGILSVAVLGIGVLVFFAVRGIFMKPTEVTPEAVPVVQGDGALRHPLTGEKIDTAVDPLPHVFGVMVENSYEAWPLSGLNDAFLVIEAPVEGNIPRFISFFYAGQDAVEKIGPVRSARPYYLDWADEFEALYTHVGGSPEALDLIASNGTTHNFDQFFQSEYFWRDTTTRFAPHNVYTSTALLTDALDEVKLPEASYGSWLFKDDAPAGNDFISPSIDWANGSSEYDVTWGYDAATNMYGRSQGSTFVKTSSGEGVTANNVVIMETDIEVVDAVGRRHAVTTGEGHAFVYQDGKKIDALWKKALRTDRLRFYADGKEIQMNAGKTWIEVIDDLGKVTEETETK
jgi:hypothetical protein